MTTVQNDENPKKKKLVVLYAPPGLTGHLVPMVELTKLLLAQGLEVTVVIGVEAEAPDQGADVAGIVAANPSLSFHCLPAATLPSDAGSYEAKVFELVRASNPDLRDFLLRSASSHRPPAALLLDLFCSAALDVGAELGIPTYFFLTNCIGILALSLYQPVLQEQTALSFGDLGGDLVHVPGLPPIPAHHIPAANHDRNSLSYKLFIDLSQRWCDSRGVIVNSCRSLEPRAADAIVSGLCTAPGRRTPPLYTVGPLIKPLRCCVGEEEERPLECLAWLDGQPEASVVFLCFGSMGVFGAKQVKQIAAGLEASGQRFLWAMRPPPDHDDDEHLLGGFMQRTKGRGLVLTSWAPQREVLVHAAVGGFVTHCGWNSVLESVTAGVPMLAWPLYAEQRMNKVFLVEEMRLAVAMEGYDKDVVEAQEVAAKVTWLIESDGGRELRQRALDAKRRVEDARSDDGESKAALMHLATQWKTSHDNEIVMTGYSAPPSNNADQVGDKTGEAKTLVVGPTVTGQKSSPSGLSDEPSASPVSFN